MFLYQRSEVQVVSCGENLGNPLFTSESVQHLCRLKSFRTPTDIFRRMARKMKRPFTFRNEATRAMKRKVTMKKGYTVIFQINVTGDMQKNTEILYVCSRQGGGWETVLDCSYSTLFPPQTAPSP